MRVGGEAKLGWLGGPRARVGGQAGWPNRLGCKAKQAWAAAAPSSSLSPVSFSFSISFCIMLHFFHVYKSKWHISPLV